MAQSMQRQVDQLGDLLIEKKSFGDSNARLNAELDLKQRELDKTKATLEDERKRIA